MRGFDDCFWAPHSRYTTIDIDEVKAAKGVEILSVSPMAGIYLLQDCERRNFYVTGHPEYDRDTLKNEYLRDIAAGKSSEIPYSYFPNDDIKEPPLFSWRSHANLLYANWLNYFVYQETPFDLSTL